MFIIMGILMILSCVYGGVAAVTAVAGSHLKACRANRTMIQVWKKDPLFFMGFGIAWPISLPFLLFVAPVATVMVDVTKAVVPEVTNSYNRNYHARVESVKREYGK